MRQSNILRRQAKALDLVTVEPEKLSMTYFHVESLFPCEGTLTNWDYDTCRMPTLHVSLSAFCTMPLFLHADILMQMENLICH